MLIILYEDAHRRESGLSLCAVLNFKLDISNTNIIRSNRVICKLLVVSYLVVRLGRAGICLPISNCKTNLNYFYLFLHFVQKFLPRISYGRKLDTVRRVILTNFSGHFLWVFTFYLVFKNKNSIIRLCCAQLELLNLETNENGTTTCFGSSGDLSFVRSFINLWYFYGFGL